MEGGACETSSGTIWRCWDSASGQGTTSLLHPPLNSPGWLASCRFHFPSLSSLTGPASDQGPGARIDRASTPTSTRPAQGPPRPPSPSYCLTGLDHERDSLGIEGQKALYPPTAAPPRPSLLRSPWHADHGKPAAAIRALLVWLINQNWQGCGDRRALERLAGSQGRSWSQADWDSNWPGRETIGLQWDQSAREPGKCERGWELGWKQCHWSDGGRDSRWKEGTEECRRQPMEKKKKNLNQSDEFGYFWMTRHRIAQDESVRLMTQDHWCSPGWGEHPSHSPLSIPHWLWCSDQHGAHNSSTPHFPGLSL